MEEHVDPRKLKMEDGATELSESPAMEPYMALAVAVVGNHDAQDALQKISELALEQRYIWRVASALKWAFADFDTLPLEADRQTLGSEELHKILELIKPRPIQFCMFLSALYGHEQMQRMMLHAVAVAKTSQEGKPG